MVVTCMHGNKINLIKESNQNNLELAKSGVFRHSAIMLQHDCGLVKINEDDNNFNNTTACWDS